MSWDHVVALGVLAVILVALFGTLWLLRGERPRRPEPRPAYRRHWDAEPFEARYWITGVWICPDALCGSFIAWSVYDDDEAVEREIEEHERRAHGIE